MRKVVTAQLMSLDGVTEAPEKWQLDYFDEAMMNKMTSVIAEQDTVLMGRVTYQEWERAWANSDFEPFASFINKTPKFVVSETLDAVPWGTHGTATLVRGDLAEEVTRLKQQDGGDIGVQGSSTLARWLLQNDLLDELHLMIHPVVAGNGKRLFESGSELKRLELVDSQTSSTGVAFLTYRAK